MSSRQDVTILLNSINTQKNQIKLIDLEDIQIRKRANEDMQKIFYSGSIKKEISRLLNFFIITINFRIFNLPNGF
jgi:hypothetical protein